jgi:hypothetical protein
MAAKIYSMLILILAESILLLGASNQNLPPRSYIDIKFAISVLTETSASTYNELYVD